MQLPKSNDTIGSFDLPDGRKIPFAMMKKKDEKSLMIIKEGEDRFARAQAIANIVQNRTEGKLDPQIEPKGYIEFAFYKIRSASVDSEVSITFDDEGQKKTLYMNLEEVELKAGTTEPVIDLSDHFDMPVKVEFHAPTIFDMAVDREDANYDARVLWNALEALYVGPETYTKTTEEFTVESFIEWIDDMSGPVFSKLVSFVTEQPKAVVGMKIDNGEEEEVSDLLDFLLGG